MKRWKKRFESWFFRIENEIMVPFLAVNILVILAFGAISCYNGYSIEMSERRTRARMTLEAVRDDLRFLSGRLSGEELEKKYRNAQDKSLRILTEDGRVLTGPETLTDDTRILLREIMGDELRWQVEYLLYQSEFNDQLIEEQRYVIVGAVASLLIIVQVSMLLAWYLTKPVRSMSATCMAIRENQMAFREYRFEAASRKDELGQLAQTFEGLLKSLDDYTKMEYTSRMSATLAHEIKNPLAGIRSGIQVLGGRANGESEKLLCGSMIKEIDRVTGLINNLFTLSVKREAVRTRILLAAFFGELETFYAKGLMEKGIAFTARAPEGLAALAGENELRQILHNLITNSVKALREKENGVIRLTAEAIPDGRVMLTLADNGCGMAKEELARAMEPFYTKSINGVGIGLAIVNRLAAQNHGSIEMESEPGRGTAVRLILEAGPALEEG